MDMSFNLDRAQPVALDCDFAPPGYDPRVTTWLIEEIFADIAHELKRREAVSTSC